MADVTNVSVISGTNSQKPANSTISNDIISETVMAASRPILLEESTRQQTASSLELLIAKLYESKKEVTKLELIATLIYILMLETGFNPNMKNVDEKLLQQITEDINFNKQRMELYCSFSQNWTVVSKNCIEIRFFMKPCQETFEVIVSMTTFGSGITLNAIVTNSSTNESEHLFPYFIPIAKYILNENASINWKFNNLRELSIDFKNKVAFPIKCTILNAEYKKHACLQYLPYELLTKIAKYLLLRDFIRFTKTCKHLNQLSHDQEVWKSFCMRDYSKSEREFAEYKIVESGKTVVGHWEDVYKTVYQDKKRHARESDIASYLF